jgi:hypothetical protein
VYSLALQVASEELDEREKTLNVTMVDLKGSQIFSALVVKKVMAPAIVVLN